MSAAVIALPERQPNDDWIAEATYFTLDVFDHENEGRLEIDPFRFKRYVALGWIREIETRPYYLLTTNGEDVYRSFYWEVAKRTGWDSTSDALDWYDDEDDDDED